MRLYLNLGKDFFAAAIERMKMKAMSLGDNLVECEHGKLINGV
jgi:hypothetical protein